MTDQAGFIASRKCSRTGTMITVVRADEAGIDAGAKYATVCEQHGSILGSSSKRGAISAAAYPEWCPQCSEVLDP